MKKASFAVLYIDRGRIVALGFNLRQKIKIVKVK